MNEYPYLLVKWNLAYHEMIKEIGDNEIDTYLSPSLKEAKKYVDEKGNQLKKYLSIHIFDLFFTNSKKIGIYFINTILINIGIYY